MIKRFITDSVVRALRDTPVVLINGARQSGKSTLAQFLSSFGFQGTYLTLDDPTVMASIQTDPYAFLSSREGPLILDEVQRAPEIFPAIKLLIDRNRKPGQYLLTGSANILSIPKISESLAGRMEIIPLFPFSQSEIEQSGGSFIDHLFQTKKLKLTKIGWPDLKSRILKGGYPEAVQRRDPERRDAWFASYLTSVLQRDIRDIAHIEGLSVLPRLLALLAARTGSLHNHAEAANSLSIPQSTLKRYLLLLETTFLAYALPAWSSNLGKRLIKSPKIYVTDTGLAAHLMGADPNRWLDMNVQGKLAETFVLTELIKLCAWSNTKPTVFHYRSASSQEIDFILESRNGSLICIEVKSGQKVSLDAFKTIKMFREEVGERFIRGVVLYDGEESVTFEKNLFALPFSSLWKL